MRANAFSRHCPLRDSGGFQDLDWRRQALGVNVGGALNLSDDIHALHDTPKGREPLTVGIARAAEVERGLIVVDGRERFGVRERADEKSNPR